MHRFISFAVVALLSNCNAAEAAAAAASGSGPPVTVTVVALPPAADAAAATAATAVYVPKGTNGAVADKIKAASAAVPAKVGIDMPNGRAMGIKIDQGKVRDVMQQERNFWRQDARKIEELPQIALIAPLERTKVRIAGAMASVLRPASEALPLMMKTFPNTATCKPAAFLDCVWKMPRKERRGDQIFNSKCAVASGCKPELVRQRWTDADNKAANAFWNAKQTAKKDRRIAQMKLGKPLADITDMKSDNDQFVPERMKAMEANNDAFRQKERQVNRAIQKLGNSIARDFMMGQRAAQQIINAESKKWVEQTKGVMIRDFQCDSKCIGNVHWDHVNPFDFVGGRCSCRLPIQPGAVIDWQADDFNTISMEEWMDIADQEGIEIVETAEEEEIPEVAEEDLTELGETGTGAEADKAKTGAEADKAKTGDKAGAKTGADAGTGDKAKTGADAGTGDKAKTGADAGTAKAKAKAVIAKIEAKVKEGGNTTLIAIILSVLGISLLGGGFYCWKKKQDDEKAEGGKEDLYQRFI